MPDPHKVLSRRQLLSTPIFDVNESRSIHPVTGEERGYIVLDNPDWVNVVALTEAGELVMVRQWRHGVERVLLELPAGLVEDGEAPVEAARRELLEETGYAGTRWREIGHVLPNPAYQHNRCTTLLVEGCRQVAEGGGVDSEDIEVVRVDPAEIPALLAGGELKNAMTFCALIWWLSEAGALDWGALEAGEGDHG